MVDTQTNRPTNHQANIQQTGMRAYEDCIMDNEFDCRSGFMKPYNNEIAKTVFVDMQSPKLYMINEKKYILENKVKHRI